MIATPKPQPMTPQEYLEWEEHQPIKYEYVNGEVFAMTGANLPHNSIALNLASALKFHLTSIGFCCPIYQLDEDVELLPNNEC